MAGLLLRSRRPPGAAARHARDTPRRSRRGARRTATLGLALAVLACGAAAHAQAPGGLGAWAMYFGSARLADTPFSVHTDVQYRQHDVVGDLDQLLIRFGPQVSLPGRAATFTQGYAYVRTEAPGEPDNPFDEHRLYQEGLVPQRVGPVRLAHRLRLEERFVDGGALQTRARYALFATVPLVGDAARRGAVYANAYAEPFLRGPGRGAQPVYDRTRLYGALGYRLRDDLGVQAGYLAQVFDGRVDHQLQLSLHQSLSIRR